MARRENLEELIAARKPVPSGFGVTATGGDPAGGGNGPDPKPPKKPPVTPPTVDPKPPDPEPVNTQRPPDVAGDRKPAATQSITGQKPIPIPMTGGGGDLNMANWVRPWEEWGRDMMRMGFLADQLPAIAAAQGGIFPKSLVATFNSQDQLGPRADMLQQYDLQAGQQRSVPHINADYPGGTGYGEWQAIPDNVRQAQNDFFNWAYDPANYDWINKFGGHAFAAWMASPSGRGTPGALQGFGGTSAATTVSPVTPTPVPGTGYPDSPTASASLPKTVQSLTNSLSNPIGFGSSALATAPAGPTRSRSTAGVTPAPAKTAPPVSGTPGVSSQRDPSQPKRGWYSGFGM